MQVVIDRFESNFVVVLCPDSTYALMPRKMLPDARPGDLVDISVVRDTGRLER